MTRPATTSCAVAILLCILAVPSIARDGEIRPAWLPPEVIRTFGTPDYGHAARVCAAAVDAERRRVLLGLFDGTVQLWVVGRRRWRTVWQGHDASVFAVALSPDGRRAATGSADGTIRIWDLTARREPRTLEGHEGWITTLDFLPEGRAIVSGGADGTIRIHDVESDAPGRVLHRGDAWITSIAALPGGGKVLSGDSDGVTVLRDVRTGGAIWSVTSTWRNISGLAVERDGMRALTGNDTGLVRLLDMKTGEVLSSIRLNGGPVQALAFRDDKTAFHDDRTALIGAGSDVLAWTFGKTVARRIGEHDAPVLRVGVDAKRSEMLSVSATCRGAGIHDTVRRWRLDAWFRARPFPWVVGDITAVAFSPDGTRIASGSSRGVIRLWDTASGLALRTNAGHRACVTDVAVHPDGERILSCDRDEGVRLWSGGVGRDLPLNREHPYTWWTRVAFSPDGKRALAAGPCLRVWEADGKDTGFSLPVPGYASGLLWREDGRVLVASCNRYALHLSVVDLATRELETRNEIGGRTVSFSRDGKRALGSWGSGSVWLTDLTTGKEIWQYSPRHGWIKDVALSPDGHLAMVGCRWALIILDADTGRELRRFPCPGVIMNRVRFSPDGRRVLTGTNFGVIYLWDLGAWAR